MPKIQNIIHDSYLILSIFYINIKCMKYYLFLKLGLNQANTYGISDNFFISDYLKPSSIIYSF